MTSLAKFLHLCSDYLAEKISGEDFKTTYEMYMFDYGDDIAEEIYLYLDNILDAVTYFDASELREDDEHYMAEEELRATVRESLDHIQALL